MNDQLRTIILKTTDSSEINKIEKIQDLWSGYGQLNRVTTDKTSVIIKLIQFPKRADHPKGWNTTVSHERKKRSYEVEANWYQKFNSKIDQAYSPRLLGSGVLSTGENFLLLEDLKTLNYLPKKDIKWKEIELCLNWLANFHRNYLGVSPAGLWAEGTYWHLATRPDELTRLQDQDLKKAASKIDKALNEASFQTLVHGDAKLANFLFSDQAVAAVDFQYVGGGIGIKDVAYFLSSIFNEEELEKYETKCLDTYFQELNHKEVEEQWRELYPVAWCDFYRFLKGWSPEHYKINTYSENMKNKVLKWI